MDCGLAWIGFGCVWEYHITSPPLRLPPLPLVAPFHRLSFCSSRSVPFFLLSRISNSFSNRSNSHLISLRSFIPLNSNSFLRLFAYLAPPLLFLSSSLPHILHEFSFSLTPSSVCTQYIQLVSLCVLHIDMLSLCSLPNVTCYYTRIHAQSNLAILPPFSPPSAWSDLIFLSSVSVGCFCFLISNPFC